MKILSIDTTYGICSVALLADNKIIGEVNDDQHSKQAEKLLPIIEDILQEASITYDDLDAIAANIGPGSFTGTRIGLSAAKAMVLVKDILLISVNSFESVAYPIAERLNQEQNENDKILVVLDAKRGQVFAQVLSKDLNPTSEDSLLSYEDITNILDKNDSYVLTGSGSNLVKEFITKEGIKFKIDNDKAMPKARDIAFVALKKMQSEPEGNSKTNSDSSPLYIRKPDAKPSQSAKPQK